MHNTLNRNLSTIWHPQSLTSCDRAEFNTLLYISILYCRVSFSISRYNVIHLWVSCPPLFCTFVLQISLQEIWLNFHGVWICITGWCVSFVILNVTYVQFNSFTFIFYCLIQASVLLRWIWIFVEAILGL